MSTLVIDTIQGKTTAGSVNVRGEGSNNTNLQQGLAKQWVVFQQKSANIVHDSFNTSSVTDQAQAIIFPNFTSNMASVNYAPIGGIATGTYNGAVMSPTSNGGDDVWSVETGGYYISCRGNGGVFTLYADVVRVPVGVLGDLA